MTARLLLRMGDGNSQWLDEELGSMAGHPCRLLAQRGQWGLWKLLESVCRSGSMREVRLEALTGEPSACGWEQTAKRAACLTFSVDHSIHLMHWWILI